MNRLALLRKGPWEGPLDLPRRSAAGQSPAALTRLRKGPWEGPLDLPRRSAAGQSPAALTRLHKGPWEGPLDPPRRSAAGQSPAALTRLVLVIVAGCAPKYSSGITQCSNADQCPSGYFCGSSASGTQVCLQRCSSSQPCPGGFVCSDDGVNPGNVCLEEEANGGAGAGGRPSVSSAGGTSGRAGGAGGIVAGSTVVVTGGSPAGPGGRGGASSASAAGGRGGTSSGGTLGGRDAGCGGGCASGQQCLGGQCCAPPAAGGVCNLPACGCSAGMACYPSSTSHAMACLVAGSLAAGADCSSSVLNCQIGLGCFGGTCKLYCSSASDCPAVAGLQTCLATTWPDDNADIPGVKVCGRICDPAHPQNPVSPLLACPAGFNCQTDPAGLSYCYQASPLPPGSACTTSADCSPGYYCTVSDACNRYCLTNSDCPTDQTCYPFSTATMAGAYSVGYCDAS